MLSRLPFVDEASFGSERLKIRRTLGLLRIVRRLPLIPINPSLLGIYMLLQDMNVFVTSYEQIRLIAQHVIVLLETSRAVLGLDLILRCHTNGFAPAKGLR